MLKRFVINAYDKRFQKELREKFSKKGLLIKVLNNNKKRTDTLLEILKESDDLNTLRNSSYKKSEEEYLSKFRNVNRGGPKHSIALNRAHHLTNFLSEYILNAFQSGHFESPDIPNELSEELDFNNFKKEKYSFEISNVELMSDLSALKIFWYSSENEKINKIVEDYLEKKLKSQIRTTLIAERVMNYVPKIVFIRDESKFLMNQLDNFLTKFNLETKIESTEVENYKNDNISTKNKNVNNLYGINVEDMIRYIKKDASNKEVNEIYKPETSETKNCPVILKSKFEKSLKAFEISKRIKYERISKSTLHKLAQLDFEEFKNKNLT